jgi:hypothetical protein
MGWDYNSEMFLIGLAGASVEQDVFLDYELVLEIRSKLEEWVTGY